jgi:hypothetical protein
MPVDVFNTSAKTAESLQWRTLHVGLGFHINYFPIRHCFQTDLEAYITSHSKDIGR